MTSSKNEPAQATPAEPDLDTSTGAASTAARAASDDITINSQFAEVNGTRLHYLVTGEGPLIVLLHGWPCTSAEWLPLMPLLAAAGYTALAPDLRGLGGSAPADSGYSKRNVAEDVRQLAKHLGHIEIDLMGTDIGAMVAYAYAADSPDQVRHLVLAESLLPGFGLEELMNPATGGYWHFGFHMQVDLAEMLTAGKEANYLAPLWSMFSPAGHIDDATQADYLRQYAAPGRMRAGFSHYATLVEDGKANRNGFSGKLEIPVLVLNGEMGLPQEPLLRGARQVAEHVEADMVPASGHALANDNPAWLAQRMIRFLENSR